MKIALIHIRFIYKGGLETRLFNYIDYFHARGHEVHVYTSRVDPEIAAVTPALLHLVDVSSIPKPLRNYFFNRRLGRMIARDRYDFILSLERTSHQRHVIAPSTHRGYLEARGSRVPDPIDLVQIHMDRIAFERSEVIYACSSMVRDEIVRFHGIDPAKITVLPPPTDPGRFDRRVSRQEARRRLGLDPDAVFILFVSTSHRRKGLPLLRSAMRLIAHRRPEVRLLVAGTDAEDEGPIRFLGFVRDMAVLYRAADLTVHPAIYEPYGQIVSESLFCGTPVVVSDRTGAKDFVGADEGLVVSGRDPAVWADAMLRALASDARIPEDFATRHGLTLDQHMDAMHAASGLPQPRTG